MWQHTHAKLEAGRANDWPFQGVASSPLVEGEKLYYVSNRGVLWCVDTKGFHDGENDGPLTDEKLTGKTDADTIWAFDMMEEVGTYPHNLANSSPVAHGNLIFVSTSNGQDESHVNIPSPRAPSIIAVDKNTGKLVWEDNSVEDRILHGQWSTPTVGEIGGVVQVISAQGDGWVRGYEAQSGKKLWEFDTNPKDSVWPRTRNELISTPVVFNNRVYIANGQDPEHGEGIGHFYAIDATKRGDITETGRIFHFEKIRRSISTPGDRRRADLHPRLQRLLPLPRRQHRAGVLGPRPHVGGVELADGHGRQGLHRQRGRRRGDPAARQGEEADQHHQHGERGLRLRRAGQRHLVRDEPEPVVCDSGKVMRKPGVVVYVLGSSFGENATNEDTERDERRTENGERQRC